MRKLLLAFLFAAGVAHADVSSCWGIFNLYPVYTGTVSHCITSTTTPCSTGEPIQFAAVAFGGSDPTCNFLFQWNFGDGATATGQFPTHVYADPGNYELTLTITSPQMQLTHMRTVVVIGDPPPAFEVHELFAEHGRVKNGYLFTIGHATGAGEWLWNFGDGTTARSVEREQAHVYKSGGKFLVTLTSTQSPNSYALEVNVPVDRRRSARH